jgi:hypothetical protein
MFRMVVIAFAVMVFCAAQASAQQSLADQARKARQQQRQQAKRSYDNDDVALAKLKDAQIKPVEEVTVPLQADSDGVKPAGEKMELSDEEKKAELQADFKARASEIRKAIEEQEHAMDLADREAKVQASTYYVDAGARLRDPQKYQEMQTKALANKKTAQEKLDKLRAQLDDVQEQARKAGVRAE